MHIYQRHIAELDQHRWLDPRIALDILFGDMKETILQFFQKPEWGIMKFSNFEKIHQIWNQIWSITSINIKGNIDASQLY